MRWVIASLVVLAATVFVVPPAWYYGARNLPGQLIKALSRPASAAEMEEIAVAAIPRAVPSLFQRKGGIQPFSVTISGHDPRVGLLPRLSHGDFVAIPNGEPDIGGFTVDMETFSVSPFGIATGQIRSDYGNLGCQGWRFSLGRRGGQWDVISQRLEVMC